MEAYPLEITKLDWTVLHDERLRGVSLKHLNSLRLRQEELFNLLED